ncbi:MAG: hypothetical protein ACE5HD_07410 [Acidobacteriota bacterium]
MKYWTLILVAVAQLALPGRAARAEACANSGGVDFCAQCQSTSIDQCDSGTTQVTVQLGGIGSVNNEGTMPGILDDGTKATALVTITQVDADTIDVEIRNTTCATATLTALFLNITPSVTGMNLISITPAPTTPDWTICYDQTSAQNDGHGFKAGGFGHFDAVISNSKEQGTCDVSPNGGNPMEILAGDTLTFRIDIVGPWSLCDLLTELSQPTPPELLRTMAARFQTGTLGGSGRIAPCAPGTPLLANYRFFRTAPASGQVVLDWATSLEFENAGFNILRLAVPRGGWEQINSEFIVGRGDSLTGAEYTFVDGEAINGVEYVYRLQDINFAGIDHLSRPATAVANPRAAPVHLASPAYGAQVDLSRDFEVGFDASRRGSFVIQMASSPLFPAAETVAARVPVRIGSSTVRLNPRAVRLARKAAGAGDGILYWRLVDRGGSPLSETFRMEVK